MKENITVRFSTEDMDYEADIEITYVIDDDYGADADGRGGIVRRFDEDAIVTQIRDIDDNIIDITPELEDLALKQI